MNYVLDYHIVTHHFPLTTPRAQTLQCLIKEKCLTNLQIVLAVYKGI